LGDGGILAAAAPDKILVASSTLSVAWIDELAKTCQENEYQFFDMPLTGGRVGAETGNMTMLVGGDKQTLEKLKPTLEPIAGTIFHFGPAGHGTRYKLLLNMLQGIHMTAYGEVMKMAEAANMNIAAVSEALVHRPGGVITGIARDSYHNQPDPITFSVEWITKDLAYAKQFAGEVQTPLLEAAHATFKQHLDNGQADQDWSSVNESIE